MCVVVATEEIQHSAIFQHLGYQKPGQPHRASGHLMYTTPHPIFLSFPKQVLFFVVWVVMLVVRPFQIQTSQRLEMEMLPNKKSTEHPTASAPKLLPNQQQQKAGIFSC